MHEHWLPVVGYEGLYEVSDMGNVRSRRRAHMKTDGDRYGYRRIVLQRNCATQRFLVHILVMAAFVGPKVAGMTVNHRNGVKSDNRLPNLEYMSQSENELHSFRELGRISPGGSKHWNHKLNEEQVQQIIKDREYGHSIAYISGKFAVSQATISMICNRRTWRRVIIP